MITDLLAKWLLPALKRASNNTPKRDSGPEIRASRGTNSFFDHCETLQLRVIKVSNSVLIRIDTAGTENDFKFGPPQPPHIFVVKDNETVQDVIVRMLAIHQLEK